MKRLSRTATLAFSAAFSATLIGQGQLAGQTPTQFLFDWDTPAFPQEAYVARRLAARSLSAERDGVLLAFSGHGLSHGETFRQLDDFSYLVGLELPQSVLAIDGRGERAVIFIPTDDARFESRTRPGDFPGRPLASDPRVQGWLADVEIRAASAVDAFLDSLATEGRTLFVNPGALGELPSAERPLFASEEEVTQTVRAALARWPQSRFASGFSIMAVLRSVKSPEEIQRMERVARMTARAIVRASRDVSPGTSERTLEGAFIDACKSDGSPRAAFAPIIKSGPNSLWPWRILASHYDRRDRQMLPGDLVIFDVGCELDGYISDVGRTLPVTGTFSELQRNVLNMEVDVSDRIIAAVRPGVTLAELQIVADAAIPEEAKPYMQVGLFFGHHLGLSTSDPVLTAEPLRPGMIFTVEPWYYNHDLDLSVFTEDEVLVTQDGRRNLTADLPRRPAAIEALMRSGVVPGLSTDPAVPAPPASLEEVVDGYAATWNEPDPLVRAEALSRVWAEDGRYRDPTAHLRGRAELSAHIATFRSQLPGSTIRRSGAVQRTGAHFYFAWEIVDSAGSVLATGRDTGELDVDGRILHIRGFFDGA